MQSNKILNSKLKIILDKISSFLFLTLIFSWLYPLIALAIKLESKGPALFVQKRVGLQGKVFNCYKFRTLYINKNSLDKDSLALSYTVPVTKVGAFLRKYNLDELPQFINVFLGSMSMVGPRPHAIAFHNVYKTYVPNIDDRLAIKPGITGWAQIQGLRGDVENEQENKILITKRVAADLYYIQNWSFGLDVKIILKTFLRL